MGLHFVSRVINEGHTMGGHRLIMTTIIIWLIAGLIAAIWIRKLFGKIPLRLWVIVILFGIIALITIAVSVIAETAPKSRLIKHRRF
jgi:CBS domain containing-hemolysin-like protein